MFLQLLLATLQSGRKKCSCSHCTSNPQGGKYAFFSGVRLGLASKMHRPSFSQESKAFTVPKGLPENEAHWLLTSVGSARLPHALGSPAPQWNTHYQSFPATSEQANKFSSSTLSGHPDLSRPWSNMWGTWGPESWTLLYGAGFNERHSWRASGWGQPLGRKSAEEPRRPRYRKRVPTARLLCRSPSRTATRHSFVPVPWLA